MGAAKVSELIELMTYIKKVQPLGATFSIGIVVGCDLGVREKRFVRDKFGQVIMNTTLPETVYLRSVVALCNASRGSVNMAKAGLDLKDYL